MNYWIMDDSLDLLRLWAALVGMGCLGLVGVLVTDHFSGPTEEVDQGVLPAEPALSPRRIATGGAIASIERAMRTAPDDEPDRVPPVSSVGRADTSDRDGRIRIDRRRAAEWIARRPMHSRSGFLWAATVEPVRLLARLANNRDKGSARPQGEYVVGSDGLRMDRPEATGSRSTSALRFRLR